MTKARRRPEYDVVPVELQHRYMVALAQAHSVRNTRGDTPRAVLIRVYLDFDPRVRDIPSAIELLGRDPIPRGSEI